MMQEMLMFFLNEDDTNTIRKEVVEFAPAMSLYVFLLLLCVIFSKQFRKNIRKEMMIRRL